MDGCRKEEICKKTFNISHIVNKAYHPNILLDMLRTCCGPCANVKVTSNLNKLSEVTDMVLNTSDFVFPVLGRRHSAHVCTLLSCSVDDDNVCFTLEFENN